MDLLIPLFFRFAICGGTQESDRRLLRHTLVAARAIGGLCWGLAAVHYPTWVNRQAHEPICMCDDIVFGFQTVRFFLGISGEVGDCFKSTKNHF